MGCSVPVRREIAVTRREVELLYGRHRARLVLLEHGLEELLARLLFVWVWQNRRIVDQTVWTPGLVYSFLVIS